MWLIVVKYAVTAGVVVAVSELAKRTDRWGAILASLPLVSLLVVVWMVVERQPPARVGQYLWYTFWYVLPTLPMFVVMPWLIGRGWPVWVALAAGALLTGGMFVGLSFAVRPLGIELLPSGGG
ncbi:MAG: DUF3147 family protein [Planctomycetota bacterium]